MVYLEFNDLDIASKMKIESHELNKMTQGLQGIGETRKKSGLKPLSPQEIKGMQKELQYDSNQETANETALMGIKAQAAAKKAAASKTATSAGKKKAAGSSAQTKSIAKPKNQHSSDFVQGILNILDSQSSYKHGRLYNYVISGLLGAEELSNTNEKLVTDFCKSLVNMHITIDKNSIRDIISTNTVFLINEIEENTD